MSGAQRAAVHLLVARNLRLAGRNGGLILLRMIAAVLLLLVVWSLSGLSGVISAPGAGLVSSLVRIDFVATCLAGVFLYPALVVQEREQRTLPLLRLAGFDSWRFMLGQSMGALVQSLLLLGVQVPFLMLAVTLGGTTTDAIGRDLLVLFANLVLVYGLAMVAASRSRTMAQATMRAGLLQLVPIVSYACPILQPFTPAGVLKGSEMVTTTELWRVAGILVALGVGVFVLATMTFAHGDSPGSPRHDRRIGQRWRRFSAGAAAVPEAARGMQRSVLGVVLGHAIWAIAIYALQGGQPGWVAALVLMQVGTTCCTAVFSAAASNQQLREAQLLPLLWLAMGNNWLTALRRRRAWITAVHLALTACSCLWLAVDTTGASLLTVVVVAVVALFLDRFGERAGLFSQRAPVAVAVLGGGAAILAIYFVIFLMTFVFFNMVAFAVVNVLVFGGLAMLIGSLNRHGLTKLYAR